MNLIQTAATPAATLNQAPAVCVSFLYALKSTQIFESSTAIPDDYVKASGIYCLVGDKASGVTDIYVGKTTDFKGRISSHKRNKTVNWDMGILMIRDAASGFNRTEIDYLEAALQSRLGQVKNLKLCGGKSAMFHLPAEQEYALDRFVEVYAEHIQALAGIQTSLQSNYSNSGLRPGSLRSPKVTTQILHKAGFLQTGQILYSCIKDKTLTCEIQANGDLKILSGEICKSLSVAAQKTHQMGSSPNGWDSWATSSGMKLHQLRNAYEKTLV